MSYNPNNPNGQATMANSAPVVVASDQSAIPISAASLPLPSGAATAAKQPALGTAGTASADVITVQGISSMTALKVDGSAVTQPVAGDVAHDGVDSGNPIKQGRKAIAHGTNPTAVAAGDRTDLYANRAGIPFSIGGHPNIISFRQSYTTAQTDQAIVTVSAGTKIVVTQIQATCDAANSVDVGFRIGFGTASTPTTTGVVLTHPGIKASSGSGISRGDGSGIIAIGEDNEDLRITSEVPTGGSLEVLVSYFTIES